MRYMNRISNHFSQRQKDLKRVGVSVIITMVGILCLIWWAKLAPDLGVSGNIVLIDLYVGFFIIFSPAWKKLCQQISDLILKEEDEQELIQPRSNRICSLIEDVLDRFIGVPHQPPKLHIN
jgi:hypothetical protein